MDNKTYRTQELKRLDVDLERIEKSSLVDRKEGKADFKEVLETNFTHFETSLDFLFSGDFGYAALERVKSLSKRMNRRAIILQLIGALNNGCPQRLVNELWHELDATLQAKINAAIDIELNELDKE